MRPTGSDTSLEISPKSTAQRRKKRRYWFSKTDNNLKKLYYITKFSLFTTIKWFFLFHKIINTKIKQPWGWLMGQWCHQGYRLFLALCHPQYFGLVIWNWKMVTEALWLEWVAWVHNPRGRSVIILLVFYQKYFLNLK